MQIMALDNEQLLLDSLARAINEAEPGAEVLKFTRASAALAEMQNRRLTPDAVFLDIEMPGMTGMELARRIKELSPRTNIIFVTGFSQYAVEAAEMHASGYVMKPVDAARVRRELSDLRHPSAPRSAGRVRVQCFGNFEVFADGRAVPFLRQKSKELLAYLVDRRGAGATMAEIAAVLWEDGDYDASRNRQIHSYLSDLSKSLEAVGAGDILVRRRNSLAVDGSKFDCDYYDSVGQNPAAINGYNGEYMSQYAWAEFTAGELSMKFQ